MPQIDLAIINLTISTVFIIFSCSFIAHIYFNPLLINKVFFFFNSVITLKNKINPTTVSKFYYQ